MERQEVPAKIPTSCGQNTAYDTENLDLEDTVTHSVNQLPAYDSDEFGNFTNIKELIQFVQDNKPQKLSRLGLVGVC